MLAGLGPRQTLARHPQRWSGAARAQLRVARGGPPLRLHAPEASRSRARVGVSVGVSVSVGVGVGVGVRAGVGVGVGVGVSVGVGVGVGVSAGVSVATDGGSARKNATASTASGARVEAVAAMGRRSFPFVTAAA